jgi:Fe-S cluster assembly scaffold protein SufB
MAELVVPFAKAPRAEALAQGDPAWMADARLEALRRFDTTAVESSPLFNKHVITDGAPFALVELAPASAARPKVETLHGGEYAARVEVVDGVVRKLALERGAQHEGIILTSIRSAISEHPRLAQELLAAGSTNQSDKFFQLTRALYQDGVILEIPAAVRLPGPVKVSFVQSAPKLASFTRLIVRLHKGASAEVDETHTSSIDAPAVEGVSSEAHVGEDAVLHHNSVGNFGPQVGVFLNRQATVAARGRVNWSLGNFGGALTKSLTHTALIGNDAEVKHTEVVFGAGTQKFDISSFVTHIGHRAKSDVLARAALRHKSRANVKGMITINNRGIGADSYLGQFALLLDPEAKSVAIPGLEIETAQVVRAKHAAAVQQIDEGQVFYLQSRGIPQETARRLIVEGFLHPVIAGISSETLKAQVHSLIASKWG